MKIPRPFQSLKKSAQKVIKICQYIPLLWADEDWDWEFILNLLKYKLQRTKICIKKNDIIAEEEQDEVTRQIGIVIKLLDRVEKDEYSDWLEREIQEKYCKDFLAYLPKDSALYELMHEGGPKDHDTRFSKEEREDIQAMWRKSYEVADRMRSRDIKRAMSVMAKHIQWWWD